MAAPVFFFKLERTSLKIAFLIRKNRYHRAMTQILMLLTGVFSLIIIVLLIALTLAGLWRRKDHLPHDMFDGDTPRGETRHGHYMGSVRDDTGRAFDAAGFLSAGPGKFYLDEKGVNFLIDDVRQPVHWPYFRIKTAVEVEQNKGHWKGEKIFRIHWEIDGKTFRSDFYLPEVPMNELLKAVLAASARQADIDPVDHLQRDS
jgi:hypothetical protein